MRVAVVGHVEWVTFVRVDHAPLAGEIVNDEGWWEEPAGGGPVAAVQLAKLADGCTLFTALGNDEVGIRARAGLEALGLRVEAAIREAPTRRAFTFVDANGERTITTLGDRLDASADDPLPWKELADADAVYFSAGDAGALRAARRARVLVATSRVMDRLQEADIFLDAVVGSGSDPSERYDPQVLSRRPGLVVRTDGANGGTYETADGDRGTFGAAPLPGPLVDTYGGGDSFVAGLTFALAKGARVDEALSIASRCGAACVAGRGPYEGQLTASSL